MTQALKKVTLADELLPFFEGAQGEKVKSHLIEQLANYISTHGAKIKPVSTPTPSIYELKIKKGKDSYRLAFKFEEEIYCFYISKALKKSIFDAEVTKYLSKNKSSLNLFDQK